MTVSSAIATATLAWTGVETAFTPGFQAQSADDVAVVYASATLTQTLVLNVNYSLSLDGAGFVTVTPIALGPAPATLTISRNSTLLQEDSFADGEPWSAETIGQALDLCALRDQELRRDVKGSTTFAGLLDVEVVEGPAIDGFVPAWNNAAGKWNAVANGGGGGGGGGGNVVTSLAALLALIPAAGEVAYLNLGGRSGNFVWTVADLSIPVAQDPQQGVYVAPAPTGAGPYTISGAISPDFTGVYTLGGTFNGRNYYTAGTGKFLWWRSSNGFWVISPSNGATGIPDFSVLGNATAFPPPGLMAANNGATGSVLLTSAVPGAWIRTDFLAGKPIVLPWFSILADGKRKTATGSISMPTNPTAGQVITFAGGSTTTVTAVASSPTGNQFLIGGSAAASFANMMALVQSSDDGNISQARFAFTAGSTSAVVSYFFPGTTGNSFAMSTNVTGATVSATLSGGTATGTDNTAALLGLAAFGVYLQGIQGGHDAIAPPGEIHFDTTGPSGSFLGSTIFYNLGKWRLRGGGGQTTLVNISTATQQQIPGFFESWYDQTAAGEPYRFDLIANTTIGLNQVQLLTPANVVNYPLGSRPRIESLDIQGYGGPSNPAYYEWPGKVIEVNATTGVITFERAIQCAHRADFPDSSTSLEAGMPCGSARIWPGTVGGISWDTAEYEWENIAVAIPPNMGIGQFFNNNNGGAWSASCRSFKTINCSFLGNSMSESVIETSLHENFQSAGMLPDKIIGDSRFDNPQMNGLVAYQNPARSVQINGGYIEYFASGTIKRLKITNTAMQSFSYGYLNYGLSTSQSIENCEVASNSGVVVSNTQLFLGVTFLTIDGTNISFGAAAFTANNGGAHSYAGGVFSLLISAEIPFAAPVIGTTFGFAIATGGYPGGNPGTGIVTGLYQDGTKFYIVTSRDDLTAKPSWAGTRVTFSNIARTRTIACNGSDQVRLSSEATEQGRRDFEYFAYDMLPQAAQYSGDVYPIGEIEELGIDVYGAGSGNAISFTLGMADGTSNYVAFSGGLAVHINAAIPGRRVFNTVGLTGNQTGDTITLGGTSLIGGKFPTLAFINGALDLFALGTPFTASARVWFKTKCGIIRTLPLFDAFATPANGSNP